MYRMKLVIGIALLACLSASAPVWSQDEVLLKNGGILEGEVLGESEDSVQIRLENVGIIKLAKVDIEQVARGGKVKPTPTPAPMAEAERLGDLKHESQSRLDFNVEAKRNRPVPIPLELGGSPYQAFDNDPKTPIDRGLLRENPELALLVNQLMRGDTPDEQDLAVLGALAERRESSPGSLNALETAALALQSGDGPESRFVIEASPLSTEPLELVGSEPIAFESPAAPATLEIEIPASSEPIMEEPMAADPEASPAAPAESEPAPAAQEQAAPEADSSPGAQEQAAPEAVAEAVPAGPEEGTVAYVVAKIESLLSVINEISYSEILSMELAFGKIEVHSDRKYRRPNLFSSSAVFKKYLAPPAKGMTQMSVQNGTILWQVERRSEVTLAKLKKRWARDKKLTDEDRAKREEGFLEAVGKTYDLSAWNAADQDAGGQLRIGYILNPLESVDVDTLTLESEDEEIWTLTGEPSAKTLKNLGISALHVEIGKADGILRKVQFSGEGAGGAIIVSDVKIDPGLPDDTFSASPPDDVEMKPVQPAAK